MIILSVSLSDYMVLTLKTELYKKSDHGIINELKYIISAQRVIVDYNVTHLLVWSVNLVLLQI
jgi:predicted nucleotidyltransferase